MNAIETLDSETYESVRHYHADMASASYQTNAEYRAAVDRKVGRSWSKLRGTPGAQVGSSKAGPISVQVHTNGSVMDVGTPGQNAQARNDLAERAAAKKAETLGGLQAYMGVQVRRG